MSDSIRMPGSKLSFITTMLTKLRSLAAPAPIAPPMESMASFICSADLRRRPLIEQRRDAGARARACPFGSDALPGADQQPHADRRLFVVQDGDDLQSVRQRLDLVGRELDVARRQRTRRPLGRPVPGLRLTRSPPRHAATQRDRRAAEHAHR